MAPIKCPQCNGTGVYGTATCPICGGYGMVEDLESQLSELGARGEMLSGLVKKGVVDISTPEKQAQVMNILASGTFMLEDVTGAPDLAQGLVASDPTQTILINDGFVKGGRTYALRARGTEYLNETKRLGHDLDPGVNGALAVNTVTGTARWKRFNGLYLTFWRDAARTTKDTVNPRDLRLKIVENFPAGVLQAVEDVAAGLPKMPVATETIVYQVDAAHNPGHRLMSDIIMFRDELFLPRYYDVRLEIDPMPPATTTVVDAMVIMTILR